jgi:hypothetical protein
MLELLETIHLTKGKIACNRGLQNYATRINATIMVLLEKNGSTGHKQKKEHEVRM